MQMPLKNDFIKSPFNYTGGKYRLLPQILPYFPTRMNTFVDLFCGGGNVGINVEANTVIYNDICRDLISLYKTFYELGQPVVFEKIISIIKKYNLSEVCEHNYTYYGCDSSAGLGRYNKTNYLKLREDFNKNRPCKTADEYLMLYVLVVYAFNNQIRFNSRGEYNLPVGKRDFNSALQKNLTCFINRLAVQKPTFCNTDFRQFDISLLTSEDFVYMDPPYLITCAAYNENAAWTEKDEYELLDFINRIDRQGIKFALSNVLASKGKTNTILSSWVSENTKRYRVAHLKHSYSNSNYQRKTKMQVSDEVLIYNYEVQ